MNNPEIAVGVNSKNFENGLLLTFEQDKLQHKYPHSDNDFRSAIIFKDTDVLLNDSKIKTAYKELSKLLIDKEHNSLPELSKIIDSIKSLSTIISRVQQNRTEYTQKNIIPGR